jgi:predicted acylesterase/phospholipase RssA
MHLSFGGGGARAIVYASFLQRLGEKPSGQHALRNVKSVSGVSAGAMVGSAFAMGIKPSAILDAMTHSVFEGSWSYYPRMAATAMRLRANMYDSTVLSDRLHAMCDGGTLLVPFTAGVTPHQYRQTCVSYHAGASASSVVPAVTASAAVPFVIAPVVLQGLGACMDGGAVRYVLPMDELRAQVRSGKPVMIVSSGPWPGFRGSTEGTRKELLFRLLTELNTHGMEDLEQDLGPGFNYHDGVFRFKNVTFVAPTGAVYAANGGYDASAKLRYRHNSDHVRRLKQEGRDIADEYMVKFGKIHL